MENDAVVDSIKIEVSSDTKEASQGLDGILKTLKKLKKVTDTASGINNDGVKNINALTGAINSLSESGNSQGLNNIVRVLRKLTKLDFSNLTGATDAISRVSAAASAGGTVSPTTAVVDEVAKTAKSGTTYIPAGEEVEKITSGLESFKIALGSSKIDWEQFESNGVKACAGIGIALRKVGGKLSGLLKSFKRVAFYRLVRFILSTITNAFKEGVSNVYQYSKEINGSFAQTMDSLSSSMLQLKNSLGTMAAVLIQWVSPFLEWLIDLAIRLSNTISLAIAKMSGASEWTKAVKVQTEYADAVEKTKRSLTGFDEINTLGKQDSSADYSMMFETISMDSIQGEAENARSTLQSILLVITEIVVAIQSLRLVKFLKDTLKLNVSWSKFGGILLTVEGAIADLWGSIDAVMNGLNWKNFFQIIGGGASVVGGLAIAFGSVASSIGAVVVGLGGFFVGIYDAVKNGIDWLSGILIGAGATAAGAGIGALIGALGGPIGAGIGALIGLAVGAITDLTILLVQNWDAVKEWCANVGGAIGSFFTDTIPSLWGNFTSWLGSAWSSIKTWFAGIPEKARQFGHDLGHALGTAVKWAIDFVTEKVPTFFVNLWNTVSGALSKFFTEILPDFFSGVWEAISTFFGTTIPNFFTQVIPGWWNNTIKPAFVKFFTQTLPQFFTETVPNAFWTVIDFVASIPEKLWNAIQTGWNWLVDIGKSIIDGIWEGLQTVWQAITNFVSGFVQGFKDALGIHSPSTVFAEIGGYIIDGLFNGLTAGWETIKSWFLTAVDWINNNFVSPITNAVSGVWEDVKAGASNAWEWVSDAGKTVGETISNAWDVASDWVSDTASTVGNAVSNAWDATVDFVSSTATNVGHAVSDAASSAWDWAKDTASTVGSVVAEAASNTWNTITNVADDIGSGISNAASAVGGWIKGLFKADGAYGIPTGQMFIAREAGAEMVGSIGRKTSVANNDQIVEGIASGVADANFEQNAILREQNSLLRKLLEKDTTVTTVVSTGDVIDGFRRKNRRDGKTTVPVGV